MRIFILHIDALNWRLGVRKTPMPVRVLPGGCREGTEVREVALLAVIAAEAL